MVIEAPGQHRFNMVEYPRSVGKETGEAVRPTWLQLHFPAIFLVLGDILLLQGMTFAASAIRLLIPWGAVELTAGNIAGIHVAVLAVPLGFALAGLYPGYGLHAVDRLRRRVSVIVLGFAGMGAFDYLAQNGLWSRGILLITFAFALLLPIWDMIAVATLLRLRRWGIPVALFGAATQRAAFSALLQRNPELGWYDVEGHDWPPNNGAARRGITVAVALPPPNLPHDTSFDDLAYQHILLAPQLGPLQSHNVTARDIGPGSLILEMQRKLALRRNAIIKRLIDLVAGLVLLLLGTPIILVAALAVQTASPGAAFYVQSRRGKAGRPIRVWKIRTMKPDAEKQHPAVAISPADAATGWDAQSKPQDDPRIVPKIGHFLRRFSIDELPQLWNVLRGDMSLVGPRPLPDYHLALFDPAFIHIRQLVRPGITGLWQVTGRANLTQSDMVFHDIYYIRNWSLWLDLHILLRTLGEVLAGRGAR
jgi:exopolysaccharide biosynthesis polyprenyl glycosylphosphotransferase